MTDLPFSLWQALAFGVPIAVTLIAWSLSAFSGQKTNINAAIASFTAGLELIDFSWLPSEISSALITGFAVSTLMSNTVLTKRKSNDSVSVI